jgi:hypothetical protein
MALISEAPEELQVAIREFWPQDQWDNAASIAKLESAFDAFALLDTTRAVGCGVTIASRSGVHIVSERSVGYFQINSCNFPTWEWQRFYNARHNAGTAHMIWDSQGWGAWYFSATALGLI